MATVRITDSFSGRAREVDLDDRQPIVEEIMDARVSYGAGELEALRERVAHQERILRAVLHGCSKKDFRHTVQHFGIAVQE